MRAVAFTEFGSPPEVLDLPVPTPAEGEVRVRVHAASVNGFDIAVANGYVKDYMEHRFPAVLGKDFAGTVDEVGPGVTEFSVGDRVLGVVTKTFVGDGSFADFVTVPVAIGVAHLPEGIEFTEAASLGLAGTAAHAAVDAIAPGPGTIVLVAGATGGVGTFAVQLAAAAGAHVIATAHSEEELTLVRSLGAAETVDYTEDATATVLAAHPTGVDAVIHLAGDPAALLGAVRAGGTFASTLLGSPDQLPSPTVTVSAVYATPTSDVLERLAADHSNDRTSSRIEQVYGLEEVPAAFAHFAGGTLGKLVIKVA